MVSCCYHSSGQARALPCGEVQQGAGCVPGAAWHTAHTSGVPGVVAPQPAGAVPAAGHAGLHRGLPHLVLGPVAGGPEGGGVGEGHVHSALFMVPDIYMSQQMWEARNKCSEGSVDAWLLSLAVQ